MTHGKLRFLSPATLAVALIMFFVFFSMQIDALFDQHQHTTSIMGGMVPYDGGHSVEWRTSSLQNINSVSMSLFLRRHAGTVPSNALTTEIGPDITCWVIFCPDFTALCPRETWRQTTIITTPNTGSEVSHYTFRTEIVDTPQYITSVSCTFSTQGVFYGDGELVLTQFTSPTPSKCPISLIHYPSLSRLPTVPFYAEIGPGNLLHITLTGLGSIHMSRVLLAVYSPTAIDTSKGIEYSDVQPPTSIGITFNSNSRANDNSDRPSLVLGFIISEFIDQFKLSFYTSRQLTAEDTIGIEIGHNSKNPPPGGWYHSFQTGVPKSPVNDNLQWPIISGFTPASAPNRAIMKLTVPSSGHFSLHSINPIAASLYRFISCESNGAAHANVHFEHSLEVVSPGVLDCIVAITPLLASDHQPFLSTTNLNNPLGFEFRNLDTLNLQRPQGKNSIFYNELIDIAQPISVTIHSVDYGTSVYYQDNKEYNASMFYFDINIPGLWSDYSLILHFPQGIVVENFSYPNDLVTNLDVRTSSDPSQPVIGSAMLTAKHTPGTSCQDPSGPFPPDTSPCNTYELFPQYSWGGAYIDSTIRLKLYRLAGSSLSDREARLDIETFEFKDTFWQHQDNTGIVNSLNVGLKYQIELNKYHPGEMLISESQHRVYAPSAYPITNGPIPSFAPPLVIQLSDHQMDLVELEETHRYTGNPIDVLITMTSAVHLSPESTVPDHSVWSEALIPSDSVTLLPGAIAIISWSQCQQLAGGIDITVNTLPTGIDVKIYEGSHVTFTVTDPNGITVQEKSLKLFTLTPRGNGPQHIPHCLIQTTISTGGNSVYQYDAQISATHTQNNTSIKPQTHLFTIIFCLIMMFSTLIF